MPPQEWKHAAKMIGAVLKRKGMADKSAKSEGYAIATKQFERKHGVSPQSLDKNASNKATSL